jgi:hypothetical protein
MHGQPDAEAETEEHGLQWVNFMNFMNRLYSPNMELIHLRIAKLWAKEKCDAQTDACGGGGRK